jgi:hypothetical protein
MSFTAPEINPEKFYFAVFQGASRQNLIRGISYDTRRERSEFIAKRQIHALSLNPKAQTPQKSKRQSQSLEQDTVHEVRNGFEKETKLEATNESTHRII